MLQNTYRLFYYVKTGITDSILNNAKDGILITVKNHKRTLFFVILFTLITVSSGFASELDERLELWEANAPYCNGYLSKVSWANPKNHCDDGDSVLFAGLLCGAGDDRGCEAVRQSLDSGGRWFRSPRRRETNNDGNGNSVSPDMALGAQIYLAVKNEHGDAKRWFNWMVENTPCSLTDRSCNLKGIPRFCTDDSEKGCTIFPNHLATLAETRYKLGVQTGKGSRCPQPTRSLPEIWSLYMSPWHSSKGLYHLTDIACGAASTFNLKGAQLNDEGYPLHLVATEIFLLRLMGRNDKNLDQSAETLVRRQPQNPFFLFLRDGPTKEVLEKTLALCPSNQDEINQSRKIQWAWERADSDHASKDSMIWDCIFMAKLLQGPF